MKLRLMYAMLFAFAMVFSIAACAGPEAPVAPGAPPTGEAEAAQTPVTPEDVASVEAWGEHIRSIFGGQEINLLVGAHPSIEAMRGFYQEFVDLTGISVNFRIITDGTVRSQALVEATGRTGNFDVFAIDASSVIEFHGRGLLRDLEPFLNDPVLTPEWYDYDDIVPAFAQGIGTSQDTIVGIPIAGESRFVGFRTDLFEEHGKEPPRTMDEFLELARFFNGLEPDFFGVSMRAASGRQAGSGFNSIAFAFTDSPFVCNFTGVPMFDHPDTVEAIQFFVDLLENAPPDVTTFSHEEALAAFMQGRTAMWLDATALTGRIMDPAHSVIYDKVDFVPTPNGPRGRNGALAGWNFVIPNDAVNPELSWAWIMYMTSRETSLQYHQHGGVPSRTSIFTNPDLVAENWTLTRQLEALDQSLGLMEDRGLKFNPDFPWTADLSGIGGTFISMAMIGEMTVEEAARQGQLEMLEFKEDFVH